MHCHEQALEICPLLKKIQRHGKETDRVRHILLPFGVLILARRTFNDIADTAEFGSSVRSGHRSREIALFQ